MSYTVNALSPRLAGRFQVSTTIIKLIPLLLMGIGGLAYGLFHGITAQNFQFSPAETAAAGHPLFAAVVSAAFAYEGWIIATSINAELRNAKRNLPIALVVGALTIVAVYVLYYLGVVGGAPVADLIAGGAAAAFVRVFGSRPRRGAESFCRRILYRYAERTYAGEYARHLFFGGARARPRARYVQPCG